MPQAKEIVALVESLAPGHLAESWDNCGWQVGDPGKEVKRVMAALDVDGDVVEEAVHKGVHLVISHHPLFIKGVKSIRLDTETGRRLYKLLSSGISVYAAHTNLDSAAGGTNDVLAGKIGLEDTRVLHVVQQEKYYKLVVFVPASALEDVMGALRREGAGWIGNYSDCTFQLKGTGTFRPGENTNPYIGEQNRLERVEEIRLETIVPAGDADRVVQAMVESHPYEEVAYDLYPLALDGPAKGLGRLGNLRQPQKFSAFVATVKEKLGLPGVRYGGDEEGEVQRVAVCSGSGAEMWPLARSRGAQVLVTGDIKYHTAKDMLDAGMKFIDAGHFGTEVTVVDLLGDYLEKEAGDRGWELDVIRSSKGTDPFKLG